MNKNNSTRWLTGALMSALIASGFTACTDDHFDINSDVLGKATIWENIKSNPKTSEYADILQSVYYSQTEEKTTPETYADIFNGEQTFTVFAPVNGSFRYEYYKALLATGNRDSIYKVEKELIRNNMTRYAHVVNGNDSIKLNLFNDKTAWLNYGKKTIKSSFMEDANIGSKNGILHIVNAPVEYQSNLYEFMATRPDLSRINEFIKSYELTQFSEASSTQGPTINGNITYVDSVTFVANRYTKAYLKADINDEDSTYVMIMPTNNAWDKAVEKTQKYYVYKNSYKQDINTQTEAGKDTLIQGAETKFTDEELDSLVNLFSKNTIAENLAFSAKWQYRQIPITTIEDIRALDARKDSLHATSDVKFKKIGTLNETNKMNCHEVENFAEMFGNKAPIETSNGYAFLVDEFKLPSTVFAPTIDLDAISAFVSADNQCKYSAKTITYDVKATHMIDDEVFETRDSTYKYSYFVMSPTSSTSHPGANFRINNVLSCKYDIYVVLGYNSDFNLANKFRAYISFDNDTKRVNNQVLKNPIEDAVDVLGKSIYNTNYFVNTPKYIDEEGVVHFNDTICIAKDFEFPICYKGVRNAYPVINIKSNFQSSEKTIYSRELWIKDIILKAKEW